MSIKRFNRKEVMESSFIGTILGEDKNRTIELFNEILEGHKGFIAGGCFKDIFHNKNPKDIDVWFRNQKDFNDALLVFNKNKKMKFVYETPNSIGFRYHKTQLIELIKIKNGTPIQILKSFDFDICRIAYVKKENDFSLFIEEQAVDSIINKKINILNMITVKGTLKRIYKYAKYGYEVCPKSMNLMIKEIRKTKDILFDEEKEEKEEDDYEEL